MKIKNIIFIFIVCSIFSGCYIGTASYEVFEYNNNWNIGKSHIPKLHKNRKIYDMDRYIYIYKRESGCIYGFLTNRDDNPEVVKEWIIISGKEYCEDRLAFSLSF